MLEVFTAIFASKHKWVARVLLWCMAAFVLIYEIYYYVTHPTTMPIAFSTFSYFLFGIAVFLPVRPFKSVAAFCSFLSGVIYLAAFVFYPDENYKAQPDEAGRMMGYLMHNMMLLGGLLLYSRHKVKKTDILYIIGFFVFVAIYSEVAMHVCGSGNVNPITYGTIEATLIHLVAPQFVIKWWWYVLWYALVAVIFWGMWELTCFINRRLLRQ